MSLGDRVLYRGQTFCQMSPNQLVEYNLSRQLAKIRTIHADCQFNVERVRELSTIMPIPNLLSNLFLSHWW